MRKEGREGSEKGKARRRKWRKRFLKVAVENEKRKLMEERGRKSEIGRREEEEK